MHVPCLVNYAPYRRLLASIITLIIPPLPAHQQGGLETLHETSLLVSAADPLTQFARSSRPLTGSMSLLRPIGSDGDDPLGDSSSQQEAGKDWPPSFAGAGDSSLPDQRKTSILRLRTYHEMLDKTSVLYALAKNDRCGVS